MPLRLRGIKFCSRRMIEPIISRSLIRALKTVNSTVGREIFPVLYRQFCMRCSPPKKQCIVFLGEMVYNTIVLKLNPRRI